MKARDFLRTALLAAAVTALLGPLDAAAGRQTFSAPDASALRAPSRSTAGPAERAVRVQGEIQHVRRDFVIDGQRLVFDDLTTFFPGTSDVSRSRLPKTLRGLQATVYGRSTPRGIEAVLVILDVEPTIDPLRVDLRLDDDEPRPHPSTTRIPLVPAGNFGALTDEAPR